MKCPQCGSGEKWSMQRLQWMERIPWLRNKRCSSCGNEYAIWMGFIPMSHRFARGFVFCWLVSISALSLLGIAFLIEWIIKLRNAAVI